MTDTVIKIKSTHPASQGDFVEIYEKDFDESKGHVRYIDAPPAFVPPPAPEAAPPAPTALDTLPPNWKDSVGTTELKAIAATIDGRSVDNREQAVEMIEAALAAKAAQ